MKRLRIGVSVGHFFSRRITSLRNVATVSRPASEYYGSNSSLLAPLKGPLASSHSQQNSLNSTPKSPLKSAKLAALHARLALTPRFPIETLARCLTHKSVNQDRDLNNESLAVIGNSLLGYYVSEFLVCRYPRIPKSILLDAVEGYVGVQALALVAKEWGVESAAEPGEEVDIGLLQFKRRNPGEPNPTKKRYYGRPTAPDEDADVHAQLEEDLAESPPSLEPKSITHTTACKYFVNAVIGGIYLYSGRKAAQSFINAHVLSRKLDVGSLFQFKTPTKDVSRLCAREGLPQPVARILSETGRHSRHPVFLVGIFSGPDKLGEGAGGSLNEARIRAAVATLKGWYLYSPLETNLPSDTDGDSRKKHRPIIVDIGEIVV
ncbi:MAG: hypothetical protein M1829_005464 [Trizodia sp. TS-e1964]|nr:MAG: hypothetical protein M1829_005464 [Trizodia sp. TS-e1964]